MAFKIFNIGKANAEIDSAHAAADPILTSAKISTLKVDGKDVPAAEVPIALKITAIGSLIASGDKTQEMSELIATNGQIAAQVEELTGKLAVSAATIAANTQKISTLESELATSKSSVQTLTAEKATLTTNLTASNAEAARLAGEVNAQNETLSKACIACGCIDLTGEDGKPLAKDANDATKLAAANKISFATKMAAYQGAVNAAVAKTGVSFVTIPSAMPGAAQPAQAKYKTATELCKAAVEAQASGKPLPQYQSFKRT